MNNVQVSDLQDPDPQLLHQIGRLRVEAWATEIPAANEMESWIDEDDQNGLHSLIWNEGTLAAAARTTVHAELESLPFGALIASAVGMEVPSPIASINRLVVHPKFRRKGYGTLLDKHRIRVAKQLNCQSMIGTPVGSKRLIQLEALGFVHIASMAGPVAYETLLFGHDVPIAMLDLQRE